MACLAGACLCCCAEGVSSLSGRLELGSGLLIHWWACRDLRLYILRRHRLGHTARKHRRLYRLGLRVFTPDVLCTLGQFLRIMPTYMLLRFANEID